MLIQLLLHFVHTSSLNIWTAAPCYANSLMDTIIDLCALVCLPQPVGNGNPIYFLSIGYYT